MSNWNTNGRYHGGFPEAVKKQAEQDLPKRCAECGATDGPLWLDHIVPAAEGGPDTIDNAQWLCTRDHDAKTKAEAARGRARRASRGRYPIERHPGLM